MTPPFTSRRAKWMWAKRAQRRSAGRRLGRMSDRRPRTIASAWVTLFLSGYLALGGLAMVWAGVQMVDESALVGFAMTVVGVVTAFLGIRFLMKAARTPPSPATADSGELSKEGLDIIVLMAFGLPMVLAGLLVVFAVTGNLGT
jgi:hypothetical protein